MAELPFFPLATDAYLADCDHLTDAEHGRYMLLLMAMWRAPGQRLPNDDAWLARKFRRSVEAVVEELRPIIAEFCQCDGNWVTQKRLTREFATAAKSVKRRSDAAKTKWERMRAGESKARENGEKDTVTIGDAAPTVSANPLNNKETGGYNADAPTPTPTPTIEDRESLTVTPRVRAAGAATGKGTRLPADWSPSEELRAWTRTAIAEAGSSINPHQELAKFTDHFKAAPGVKGRKSDWDSTWRNWIRKAFEIEGKTHGRKLTTSGAAGNGASRRPGDITAARIAALVGGGAERPIRPGGGQDDLELVGSASLADRNGDLE